MKSLDLSRNSSTGVKSRQPASTASIAYRRDIALFRFSELNDRRVKGMELRDIRIRSLETEIENQNKYIQALEAKKSPTGNQPPVVLTGIVETKSIASCIDEMYILWHLIACV